MAEGYTVKHRDEFEEMEGSGAHLAPGPQDAGRRDLRLQHRRHRARRPDPRAQREPRAARTRSSSILEGEGTSSPTTRSTAPPGTFGRYAPRSSARSATTPTRAACC